MSMVDIHFLAFIKQMNYNRRLLASHSTKLFEYSLNSAAEEDYSLFKRKGNKILCAEEYIAISHLQISFKRIIIIIIASNINRKIVVYL